MYQRCYVCNYWRLPYLICLARVSQRLKLRTYNCSPSSQNYDNRLQTDQPPRPPPPLSISLSLTLSLSLSLSLSLPLSIFLTDSRTAVLRQEIHLPLPYLRGSWSSSSRLFPSTTNALPLSAITPLWQLARAVEKHGGPSRSHPPIEGEHRLV